jgi:cobalt/nickel transport system permease protein
MHVPDGFIDAPVSVGAGVLAAAGVAVCLRGARRELDDRTAPLAGLVAAFVFAVQMLNFPVAAGTSGHLLGGALAAILVGPYTGALCVAVVLLVQALLFADGGLTALGVNVVDMSMVTVVVGWFVFRALVKALPYSKRTVMASAFAAAFVSVPVSALAFVGFYAIGGTTDVSLAAVASAMVGVHLLIGLGEAVITAFTVGSVVAVRPDLVAGVRDRLPTLELRRPVTLASPDAARPGSRSAG